MEQVISACLSLLLLSHVLVVCADETMIMRSPLRLQISGLSFNNTCIPCVVFFARFTQASGNEV